MATKTTLVTCPHCGNSGAARHGDSGSGTVPYYCNNCHKTSTVYFRNGQVEKVVK